ncbi:M23 family peptidase [Bacillus salacetis]|uniref:M23 family peptidase n=1 Tax=Bacillus salacetis TaxID=2315464 RepID=A0A3A1QUS3_9BACI|nr:M23 family metallopeptidase [Bacillus salacetis]RIW31598.1 M23 family peptidase [Bacillus salacetis]
MTWRNTIHTSKEESPNNLIHKSLKLLKRAAITTAALSAITFGSVYANDNTDLETVYHVYIGKEYFGAVTDKAAVEKAIEAKLDSEEEKFESIELELAEKLSIIPEQVFRAEGNNDSVIKQVTESVKAEAKAVSISFGGKPAVLVKDQQEAELALKKLKLKFVSEEELKELEEGTPDPAEDSKLLSVEISEQAQFEETKAAPGEILTADKAVDFLLKGTLEEKKYKVQEGDVLGSIAQKHELTSGKLLELNPGLNEDSLLQIDQEINVTAYKPLVQVTVEREQSAVEAIAYEKEVIEDSSLNKGDIKVKQEGQDGEKAITYLTKEENGIQVNRTVKEEKVTKEPVKYIVIKGTKVTPSRGSGSFVWPTNGGYVSSKVGQRWGHMHKGIDIARPDNLTIKSIDNGTVVSAGWDSGGYGNKVVIDHNNGYRSVYAHMSSISVSAGQTVSAGSSVGVMGQTGQSTGVHLHLEVYKNGSLVNPLTLY